MMDNEKNDEYIDHLVDRNYEDIDNDLIGVKDLKLQDILSSSLSQGTTNEILKKFDIIYQD